jgi:hypothetical protein
MNRITRRIRPKAPADPAEFSAPAPNPDAKPLSSSQRLASAKQFAAKLNANARWTKRFLHGGG